LRKKVIVVGAGAAGIFAAINIAEALNDYSVVVLEKSSKVLAKVKISGGGRCNVTNALQDISALVKNYPRGDKFLKKAFHTFSSKDTVEWFENRGVKLKAEADGRMFPVTDNSQTVIDCLLKSCEKAGVIIKTNTGIKKIAGAKGAFVLTTDTGENITCDKVVLATGGSPKYESYDWLRELGHSVQSPVPSLFTFNVKNNPVTELQGVSVKVAEVKIAGTKLSAKGPVLITHWGFSGPAVLKLSAFGAAWLHEKNYQYEVIINWTGELNEQEVREEIQAFKGEHPKKQVKSFPTIPLPKRLWEFLTEKAEVPVDATWNNLSSKSFNRLVNCIVSDAYSASGKTTFKEEFVTCGGVSLNEVDHNTMESKVKPGVYFCGEVLDIDGVTGGFNFQAAWTTGYIVAKGIAAGQ
jgi:predicted Rossmann fold flavoprotein